MLPRLQGLLATEDAVREVLALLGEAALPLARARPGRVDDADVLLLNPRDV